MLLAVAFSLAVWVLIVVIAVWIKTDRRAAR
jgi:hypothetical protein